LATQSTCKSCQLLHLDDSLKRLTLAAGSGWNQNFGYDGFGNLLSKTGSNSPPLSVAVNAANNQIVGQGYDANGNQLTTALFSGNALTYDAENRLVHAPGVQYAYDSGNKRIWKATLDSNNTYITGQQVFFYGANGQLLGTYTLSTSTLGPTGQPYVLTDPSATPQVYFGAKRIDEKQDDQGSTIKSGSNGFFPYGEDRGTPQAGESFASYPSDSSIGLYYADQRWYSSQFGRFMTADPGAGDPRLPQSFNRYGYVRGDPVNRNDPTGKLSGDQGDPSGPPEDACDPTVFDCTGDGGSAGLGFNSWPYAERADTPYCGILYLAGVPGTSVYNVCWLGLPGSGVCAANSFVDHPGCPAPPTPPTPPPPPPPPAPQFVGLKLVADCYNRSAEAYGLSGGAPLNDLS